ncbi:MAG: hypothetical protein ISR34_09385 [Pirellulales bacterium]|nr:hypothetical protein [Pirellulales bacterium]
MVKTPYIFGIGLAKSGSNSLTDALIELGFSCYHTGRENRHNNNPEPYERILENVKLKRDVCEGIENVDALLDYPIGRNFRQLDKQIKNARFILTYRPPDDIALSWCRMVVNYEELNLKPNYEVFASDVRKHYTRVFKHFAKRPDDLLVLDMRQDSRLNFSLLAEFLKVKNPPAGVMPHSFNHAQWYKKKLKQNAGNA